MLFNASNNLISSKSRTFRIESLYMNEKSICTTTNSVFENCHIYNYDMQLISRFGQRLNPREPFFLEKCSHTTARQDDSLHFREDPQIFGITDDCVYFWTWKKCYVMCRHLGVILNSLNLHGNRNKFYLVEDKGEKYIIKHNNEARKVIVYEEASLSNDDKDEKKEIILVENIYEDDIDSIHFRIVDNEQKFALVIPRTSTVVFV